MFYDDGDQRLIPGFVKIDKKENNITFKGRPTDSGKNKLSYEIADQIRTDAVI